MGSPDHAQKRLMSRLCSRDHLIPLSAGFSDHPITRSPDPCEPILVARSIRLTHNLPINPGYLFAME